MKQCWLLLLPLVLVTLLNLFGFLPDFFGFLSIFLDFSQEVGHLKFSRLVFGSAAAAAAGSGNSPDRQTGNFQTREAADGSTSVQRRVYGPMIRGGAGAPACWLLR